jgi:undecaprenyl diphosphate synthase
MREYAMPKNELKIPDHVAVIMDGNGRWAKQRGLPRTAGHYEGAKRVKELVRNSKDLGIKAVTVFAFSTENWSRPKEEVAVIFSYMEKFLLDYKKELVDEGVKYNVIGRRDRISKRFLEVVEEVERATRDNKEIIFNAAIDYGGYWEIVEAAKKIAVECLENKVSLEKIDEELFSRYLCLSGQPIPSLLIRTSGEERISNFLLWSLAYAEFYFTDIYWPDFNKAELIKAIEVYSQRDRRFGGIKQ